VWRRQEVYKVVRFLSLPHTHDPLGSSISVIPFTVKRESDTLVWFHLLKNETVKNIIDDKTWHVNRFLNRFLFHVINIINVYYWLGYLCLGRQFIFRRMNKGENRGTGGVEHVSIRESVEGKERGKVWERGGECRERRKRGSGMKGMETLQDKCSLTVGQNQDYITLKVNVQINCIFFLYFFFYNLADSTSPTFCLLWNDGRAT
jgi:hypothetical protein